MFFQSLFDCSKQLFFRTGLGRKSTAPAFIAFTLIGTVLYPVMKIMGIMYPAVDSFSYN